MRHSKRSIFDDVYESIQTNPLFHKRELKLSKDQLLSEVYLAHFKKKLTPRENDGKCFFYLNEVIRAEEIIKSVVTELLERPDHKTEIKNVEARHEKVTLLAPTGKASLGVARARQE